MLLLSKLVLSGLVSVLPSVAVLAIFLLELRLLQKQHSAAPSPTNVQRLRLEAKATSQIAPGGVHAICYGLLACT